ncbi:hypothetical protein H0H81_010794 [Sphagnurus paluster]|uniref:Sorbose reductase sou1 n=1 Tax=Sphagnurus paluster TaxID=117069 RepID=A0A9P7G2G3_9AGAR|nr:hypothetical protein H0H81_010794 [Sphagnurus paluster]
MSIVQSVSPHAPIGVAAAIQAASDPAVNPRPKIFDEFTLTDRVAIVSGGNRGLGLEMALVLCEAGARAVYCFDLPKEPSDSWNATRKFVERLGQGTRLEYISADVRNQKDIWAKVAEIGDKEGRMDVCIAAAGVARSTKAIDCLQEDFKEVIDINTNGVLYTAQAAGRQMARFGKPGSIILIASIAGSVSIKVSPCITIERIRKPTTRAKSSKGPDIAYCSSKGAVIQMARSMACELGAQGIRVNSLSPGFILTP